MKKNMGMVDKIIRLVVAAIFVVLFFLKVVTGVWGIVMLIIALMFVVTSIISICPLYVPFGLKTNNCCKKQE